MIRGQWRAMARLAPLQGRQQTVTPEQHPHGPPSEQNEDDDPRHQEHQQAEADGQTEAEPEEEGSQPPGIEGLAPGGRRVPGGIHALGIQLGLQPGDEIHLQGQQTRESEDGLEQQARARARRQF